jgi:diacylglycerol kinase (ATP)
MNKADPYRILVMVNLLANQGNAAKSWRQIKGRVLEMLPNQPIVMEYEDPDEANAYLLTTLEAHDINCLVSVGGDGTLNALLNTLLNYNKFDPGNFYLGAVGLGSSNDFLKPIGSRVGNYPTRLNFKRVSRQDIGEVAFLNAEGNHKTRYFIVNASLGATAEANLFFNNGDWLLKFCKKWIKSIAILYAAIRTIWLYKNFPARIIGSGQDKIIMLSNLGVIKNPFVSGSFHYDQIIEPNDGKLGLNYCDNMSKKELLVTLYNLGRGEFSNGIKRVSEYVDTVSLETGKPVALETDGEVFLGSQFKFSLLPGKVLTLGN